MFVDASLKYLQPGSRNGFKRVSISRPYAAALDARIEAAGEEAPGIRVEASCLCEADFGIDPQRNRVLQPGETVTEAPALGALGGHLKVQPVTIRQGVKLFPRTRRCDTVVGEGHGFLHR
jgi:hypothetical protein